MTSAKKQNITDTFGGFFGGIINTLGEAGMNMFGERLGLIVQSEDAENAKKLFGGRDNFSLHGIKGKGKYTIMKILM